MQCFSMHLIGLEEFVHLVFPTSCCAKQSISWFSKIPTKVYKLTPPPISLSLCQSAESDNSHFLKCLQLHFCLITWGNNAQE